MGSLPGMLSKTGCGRSVQPIIAQWGARALYVGRAFSLSAHRNAVAVLAVGIDEPFGVARDAGDPLKGYRTCRTAVIPPHTLHHLQTTVNPMAFLYLDAASTDVDKLLARCGEGGDRVSFDHDDETAIVNLLRDLAEGRLAWEHARVVLVERLGLVSDEPCDPRISHILKRLHDAPADRHDLASLAMEAGLSPSRFRHVFKEATGVPFRRYRIWCRLGAAVRSVLAGGSLTVAAHAAGFSSSAHFSTAFRDMFGLSPSQLQIAGLMPLGEPLATDSSRPD